MQNGLFPGVTDLLLAASAQSSQGLGERIGRDDPTAQRTTKLGKLVIVVGQRVLALFQHIGIVITATLQFDATAKGEVQRIELSASGGLSIADSSLAKGDTQGFDTLAQ